MLWRHRSNKMTEKAKKNNNSKSSAHLTVQADKIIELKKEMALSFVDKAFKLYPDWSSGSYNLPSATKSPKLAGVALSNKQMSNLPLGEIEKSVICGTICGDSSFAINKGYKNARLQARHSTRQYTWFMWKYRVILKEFTNISSVVFQTSDGFQQASSLKPGEKIVGKLKIATLAKAKLTELHQVICVNNRKTIQRSWLNHMNNYFLMTVWLDDGSLYNGYQGLICFNSIPKAEQEVLRDYLLSVWEIETVLQDTGLIMSNGQINYRISISNQESLLKLLSLVAPVIPVREMLYKVCFVPKNNVSLLQRWRSELVGLVRPAFRADVETYYDKVQLMYNKRK